LTHNKFLNLFELDAVTKSGKSFLYYFVSRNKKDDLKMVTGSRKPEGMVIYPILKDDPDKIVLIRQYRYPLDAYLYELPAGLIDAGEDPEQSAIREMKEETGMEFIPYTGGEPGFRNAFFMGAGFTDESSPAIFGYATGAPAETQQEETELIQVLFVDKIEARRILKEERVSLRCAYLLMHFIHSDKNAPFAFLD